MSVNSKMTAITTNYSGAATGLAFSSGETGWWGNVLKRSKADNNVWTPDQYPDYWEDAE